MDINKLIDDFALNFGDSKGVSVYFAPGRVNLIGEHTDYNGGLVFPCALSFGTYLVCRRTDAPFIKLTSANFTGIVNIPVEKVYKKQVVRWVNYPLGVINQLSVFSNQLSEQNFGMEMLFSGDVPNNAGLSSSASIEMVTAVAVNDMFGLGLDKVELAKLSQKAENEFVGVNCGIMDQFASAMGKKDYAIALKCDTLEYELVPTKLGDYKLVIANTNKQRGLADSKYNERRSECDMAVKAIGNRQQAIGNSKQLKYLCELDNKGFEEIKHAISDKIIYKRAKHVISENQRVKEAVAALKAGNLKLFGKLMNESHDSLRDDYEVTGIELDTLVEEARKIKGVLGSRMTGAGFGGCTVSLVHKDSIEEFCREVGIAYNKRINLKADFYVAEVGDGAKAMSNEQ